jgi:hypothetical protein
MRAVAKTKKKAKTSPLDTLIAWADARGGPVAPLLPALLGADDAVDAWLESDEAAFFTRLILHVSFADLQTVMDGEGTLSTRRWLALARHDPERFLWAASPDQILGDAVPAWRELLLPHLGDADLQAALPWLRHLDFLSADDARDRLETRLQAAEEGAGWYALAQALDALRERGFGWKASRNLADLLDRVWVDDREAKAVEAVALDFMSLRLLVTMARHTPWRDSDDSLKRLAARVDTEGLARLLVVDTPLLAGVARADDLQLIAWRIVSTRSEAEALEATARMLAVQGLRPLGRAGGIDAVLALQKVHGDSAVRPLVHAFLAGLHRTPQGEVLERWLRGRARRALEAALDDPPDWQPAFDPASMNRLAWQLVPRLDEAGRASLAELADAIGGPRGQMVLTELG